EGEGLGGVAADAVVRREVQRVRAGAPGRRDAAQDAGAGVERDAARQEVRAALAKGGGGEAGGGQRETAGRAGGERRARGAREGRGLVHRQREGLGGVGADAVVGREVQRVHPTAARQGDAAQEAGAGVEADAGGQRVAAALAQGWGREA